MEIIRPDNRPSPSSDRYGMAITSFISGLLGALLFIIMMVPDLDYFSDAAVFFMVILTFVLLILGVIFGSISFTAKRGKGFGIAGFIISVTTLLLFLFLLLVGILVSI
ncbi:hypothetical protein D3C76_849990 [compost metagenome]